MENQEIDLSKSSVIVSSHSIDFTVRRTRNCLTEKNGADDFDFYCRLIKEDAERFLEALAPFLNGYQQRIYSPALNAVGDKLVWRCDGRVDYLQGPKCGRRERKNERLSFTAPGTWREVRNAIRRFDSEIQIIKK